LEFQGRCSDAAKARISYCPRASPLIARLSVGGEEIELSYVPGPGTSGAVFGRLKRLSWAPKPSVFGGALVTAAACLVSTISYAPGGGASGGLGAHFLPVFETKVLLGLSLNLALRNCISSTSYVPTGTLLDSSLLRNRLSLPPNAPFPLAAGNEKDLPKCVVLPSNPPWFDESYWPGPGSAVSRTYRPNAVSRPVPAWNPVVRRPNRRSIRYIPGPGAMDPRRENLSTVVPKHCNLAGTLSGWEINSSV